MLTFILFIIHVLVLPADNAQADENKLKGQSLQEPRSLQLVSVLAVLVLVRGAAAGFVVAAAVEVVDAVVAVVADVAAEKDNVEKINLVLYFVTIPAADTWPQDCSYSQGETCRARCSRTGIADQRRLALAPPSLTTLARC